MFPLMVLLNLFLVGVLKLSVIIVTNSVLFAVIFAAFFILLL